MRARTMHSTTGRRSRSRACFAGGISSEVSTGVDLGSESRWREGVPAPGVAGGVKAGEMRVSGRVGVGTWLGLWRSCHWERYGEAGRARGAIMGEAWEGRSSSGMVAAGCLWWTCTAEDEVSR
jgi:hypothetical protein